MKKKAKTKTKIIKKKKIRDVQRGLKTGIKLE